MTDRTSQTTPWPEDLGEGERIRVSGPGGTEGGVVIRASSSDRLTYRADDGVEREVHADDGGHVERASQEREATTAELDTHNAAMDRMLDARAP